jgi:DNA-binding CsgD family transcriptional regulator
MDELRQLSELIGRIYDASVEPALLPEVIERTANWIGAPRGMMFTPFHPPSAGGYALPYGIDQAGMELWGTRYQAHDIWAQRCFAAGLAYEGNVVCGHDYLPDEEFYDSVIYREHLCRYDIAQMMCGVVFDTESPLAITTACAVYRGRGDPRFGEREKSKLSLLVPHFSRALGVMLRLRDAEFRVTASLAALDRIASGILLFAAGGAVTFANTAARRIFEEGDGLKLFQVAGAQHLAAHDAHVHARLKEALATALDRNRVEVPHFARSVAVPRRTQAIPYSVQFSALPAESEFGQGRTAPQAIAFITDCSVPLQTDAALLRQVFGLTPAEARAALALCEGGSIEETAAGLGVAPTTLKTQLGSIYQKTGVDTRARLVKLVLALAGARLAQ